MNFSLLSQLYHRWWLLQAEAGLSLYFFDGDVAGNDHFDVSGRVALGGGLRVDLQAGSARRIRRALLQLQSEIAAGDDTMTSLDLGVRYASSAVIVGARFYLPLSSELRDVDMLGFGFDAGWRFLTRNSTRSARIDCALSCGVGVRALGLIARSHMECGFEPLLSVQTPFHSSTHGSTSGRLRVGARVRDAQRRSTESVTLHLKDRAVELGTREFASYAQLVEWLPSTEQSIGPRSR